MGYLVRIKCPAYPPGPVDSGATQRWRCDVCGEVWEWTPPMALQAYTVRIYGIKLKRISKTRRGEWRVITLGTPKWQELR